MSANVAGYWILNAPGHRLAELEQTAVGMAEAELASDGQVFQVVADGGEEWTCDGCNATVPVFQPPGAEAGPDPTKLPPAGQLHPVPVVDNRVLCPRCLLRRLGGDLSPANRWPGCGCAPCQRARN